MRNKILACSRTGLSLFASSSAVTLSYIFSQFCGPVTHVLLRLFSILLFDFAYMVQFNNVVLKYAKLVMNEHIVQREMHGVPN